MLRVMLTNDDGIRAPGLAALARCLSRHAEVLVVAPENPSSATSHCITLHKPLRLHEADFFPGCGPENPNISAWYCSGTPSDCAMLGLLYLANDHPVDLLISGINHGENVAQDLSYSGTVGAALEGAVNGIPSLAVSQVGPEVLSYDDSVAVLDLVLSVMLYNRTFAHQASLAESLRAHGAEADRRSLWGIPAGADPVPEGGYPHPRDWYPGRLEGTPCLNINIPDLPLDEMRGVRWTVAGRREYRDVVQRTLDPRGKPYYWIAGEKVVLEDETAGTDTHALAGGFVSVTPMSYDITNKPDLERMNRWFRER